jgi:hypothetical protein
MASMTDRNTSGNNLVNKLMQALYTSSATFTITPGTGGGSAFTITPPFLLALMETQGSNTANGTETTTGHSPGYVTLASGGKSLGTTFMAAPSGGVSSNSNSVTYTATGTWTNAINAIEIWDSAATKLRYLQGALTAAIGASTVVNGDTVSFAAAAIGVDASQW